LSRLTFVSDVIQHQAASPIDWIVGVVLGVVLNIAGIVKTIDWLKDEETPYRFPARVLMPGRPASAV